MKTKLTVTYSLRIKGISGVPDRSLILGQCRYKAGIFKGKFDFSTALYCKSKNWTSAKDAKEDERRTKFSVASKSKCIQADDKEKSGREINAELDRFNLEIENIFSKMIDAGEFYNGAKFKKILLAGDIEEEKDFHKAFTEWNEGRKKNISKARYQVIKYTGEQLKAYDKNLTYSDIGEGFYRKFKKKMNEEMENSTYLNRISIIIAFMNFAKREGLHNESKYIYKPEEIKAEKNKEIEHLTKEEVNQLWECNGLTEEQERARDMFVLVSQLGLRHSDWKQIQYKNLVRKQGGYYLNVKRTQKTKVSVALPINTLALQILSKYRKVGLPKIISSQKMNDILKRICKKAGLEKKVTTKTARKTFCSYWYGKMNTAKLRYLTGHKTEKALLAYIGVKEEVNAEQLIQEFKEFQTPTFEETVKLNIA